MNLVICILCNAFYSNDFMLFLLLHAYYSMHLIICISFYQSNLMHLMYYISVYVFYFRCMYLIICIINKSYFVFSFVQVKIQSLNRGFGPKLTHPPHKLISLADLHNPKHPADYLQGTSWKKPLCRHIWAKQRQFCCFIKAGTIYYPVCQAHF